MSVLLSIAAGHELVEPAAIAYLRARSDGCPAGITSSTRTVAEQLALVRDLPPGQATSPERSKHVYRPGTPDEGARALDLPEPARSWMRENGDRYGWVADRVAGEPWHFEYEHDRDTWRDHVLIRDEDVQRIAKATAREVLDASRVYSAPGKTTTVRAAIAQGAITSRQGRDAAETAVELLEETR